nr:MAG TPA: hypothetical protein [Caudoviricetes sp.]
MREHKFSARKVCKCLGRGCKKPELYPNSTVQVKYLDN